MQTHLSGVTEKAVILLSQKIGPLPRPRGKKAVSQFIYITSQHGICNDIYFSRSFRLFLISLFVSADNSPSTQINKVVSHPTLPLTVTAHEDRHIRFFDNNTGEFREKNPSFAFCDWRNSTSVLMKTRLS